MNQRLTPRLVSVIIPAYNGAATLPLQLAALSRQTFTGDWEILLADNGSSDGTVSVAREWSERLENLRVVDASDRQGAAHARNVGGRAARGDLIVYCDADDIVSDDWLEQLCGAATGGDLIGGRLDLLLLNDPANNPWQPRMETWISEGPAHEFLPFAVSANCAIWRDVLDAIGEWDESFSYTSEDVDLSWRVQLEGFELVNADQAVVHYRLRSTLRGYLTQHFRRALSRVQLYVRYRAKGMPRSDTKGALLTWGSLLYRLPWAAISMEWRIIWLRRAVYALGHLTGSVRWRVLYL